LIQVNGGELVASRLRGVLQSEQPPMRARRWHEPAAGNVSRDRRCRADRRRLL